MEAPHDPTPDPVALRRTNSGDRREMSVAALLAAATLAWTVATAWIGFRDSVFAGIHALDQRLTVAVEALSTHVSTDAARVAQFTESISRRLDRLEQRVDERPR